MKKRPVMDYLLPVKLQNGEKIKCDTCGQGYYKPVISDVKNCTCFICSNCGEKVNIN